MGGGRERVGGGTALHGGGLHRLFVPAGYGSAGVSVFSSSRRAGKRRSWHAVTSSDPNHLEAYLNLDLSPLLRNIETP